MISVAVPNLSGHAHGGTPDASLTLVTVTLGRRNPGDAKPTLYARNPMQEPNEIDQSDGIVYPVSRMVTDGLGRRVADHNAVGPISEGGWLL